MHLKGKILKSNESHLNQFDIVTITNNGFDLFDRSKYFVQDNDIQDIENVGIA